MPKNKILIVAAGAAIFAAGAAVAAQHLGQRPSVLTVPPPSGAVEQIRYSGAAPPQVILNAGASPTWADAPLASSHNLLRSSAVFDPISAAMDRDMFIVLGDMRAASLAAFAQAGQLNQAQFAKLPPGMESYSVISIYTGGGVCTRSVQISSQRPGQRPRLVSKTSGDCRSAPTVVFPAEQPNGGGASHTFPVKSETPRGRVARSATRAVKVTM